MINKKFDYVPLTSSYATRGGGGNNDEITDKRLQNSNIISNAVDAVYAEKLYTQAYFHPFEVQIRNQSAGEIFNLYEKLILNSQWDVRENGDYQTIILGREYMFYSVDNTVINQNSFTYNENQNKVIKQQETNPINFLNSVYDELVNNLKATDVFDNGTIISSSKKSDKNLSEGNNLKENENLKKFIQRDNCRKFSENHFAISGFNLVTHSIKMNSNVINTVSEILNDDGDKNTISILGDVTDNFISELTVTPPLHSSSAIDEDENLHRSDEFLANRLLEELRYVYQGSIIIKYNPDIEIGDTITLLDNVNSVFGVFQVDSYEHSLDQKGLITSLLVRASFTPKDPILDYHAQDMGYKLINKIKERMNGNNYKYDKTNNIFKVISLYMKYLVQAPKYCVFYKKKEKGFFNPSTVDINNVNSPTALPLRFYPMYRKGKAQIPKSIEYAFASGADKNEITSLLLSISAKIEELFKDFLSGFTSGTIKLISFLGDILISTVTFNMSELIKPLLGLTSAKAKKNTYDEVKEIDNDNASSILQYNPYENKYRLMGTNFDIVFGFFNIRLQSTEDLFAFNKTSQRNSENATSLLNQKINVVRKMLTDVFDCMLLVELYDGFNTNEKKIQNGLIVKETNDAPYTYQDFLKDCTINGYTLDQCLEITDNGISKEYGAVIKNDKLGSFTYRTIELSGDNRRAIELTYNVENLGISNALNNKVKIKQLKIAFFHNLYGESLYDKGENAIEIRKQNVTSLLEKYKAEAISSDVGVIIMADFNLNIYNEGEQPYKSNGTDINYTYRLEKTSNFIAQIKSPTTLNQYGYLKGNQYDNILLSKNINKQVGVKVFEYPNKDKLTISDHIPVYVGIKKKNG